MKIFKIQLVPVRYQDMCCGIYQVYNNQYKIIRIDFLKNEISKEIRRHNHFFFG